MRKRLLFIPLEAEADYVTGLCCIAKQDDQGRGREGEGERKEIVWGRKGLAGARVDAKEAHFVHPGQLGDKQHDEGHQIDSQNQEVVRSVVCRDEE